MRCDDGSRGTHVFCATAADKQSEIGEAGEAGEAVGAPLPVRRYFGSLPVKQDSELAGAGSDWRARWWFFFFLCVRELRPSTA